MILDVYTKIEDFIESKNCSIDGKSTWDKVYGVIRDVKGVSYVLIKKGAILKVLDKDELDFLIDNELCDTSDAKLNGQRLSVYRINYSNILVKIKKQAEVKSREADLERKLKQATKQTSVLAKELSTASEMDKIAKVAADAISSKSDEIKKYLNTPLLINKKAKKSLAGTPTLFLSDWHWSEVVDPKQIEGLNAFNMEIAYARSKRLFDKTGDLLFNHMSGMHYDGLVVALGGDILSGNIHEELQRTNEVPIADAVASVAVEIARGIRQLAREFKSVYVPCVVGNHGRLERKPTAKNKVKDNFDYMAYVFVKNLLSDLPNVKVDIAESSDIRYDIYNTRYLLTHGDQIKGGAGIGGIWPSMMKTDQRKRKRHQLTGGSYDYLICGHFHHYGMVDNIIVNGALKGLDEYAYQNNFDYEVPQQALWITHPVYGITQALPVFCEEPK